MPAFTEDKYPNISNETHNNSIDQTTPESGLTLSINNGTESIVSDNSLSDVFLSPSADINIHSNLTSSNETFQKRSRTQLRSLSRTPIFRRSNSISIPISKSANEKVDQFFSKSYSSNANNRTNYGSINQDIPDYDQFSGPSFSENAESTSVEASCEDSAEGPAVKLYFGYTKRQLNVFLSLVLLSLNDIMGYSAIATFFPVVAASKGLTATQIGIIFSAYSICGIFASLIIGTVLVKVGAKFCVLAGMFWNTGSIICFGFLDNTAKMPFFILCIACRGLMGFGSNTAFTAMFAIIFQEFSERAITVLSLSEALVGVGGMLAPLIGGGLYEAGGFMTPFLVLGGAQILLLILCWYILPYVPIEQQVASKPPFYLLRHSSAIIATLIVVYVFTVNSLLTANMAPFLKEEFQMNAVMVGVTFLVSSIFYAGMSPVWGYIADRWKNAYLIETCTLGIGVAMTLVGPAAVLQCLFGWKQQHLWLLYVSAVLNGTFFGGALMPTFNEMLKAAKELNLNDSVLAQYGLVSGLWNMAFGVGDVLGPALGGVVVEQYGMANAAALFGLVGMVLAFLKLSQRYYRYRTRKSRHLEDDNDDETKPLLINEDDGSKA